MKGTLLEAQDIRTLLDKTPFGPVTDYEGSQALEEVFLATRSPRILHVATHGFFLPDQKVDPEDRGRTVDFVETGATRVLARLRGAENPLLRSGLVFAGANRAGAQEPDQQTAGAGWVTAEEVAQMDLRGTDLVVLSACETGLGDVTFGDGVLGLRRAFFLAGARSLIMSLYQIPDAEARQLMREFYSRLKDGGSKAQALRKAQLELIRLRRAKGAAHPFFWGSFVFLGDPN